MKSFCLFAASLFVSLPLSAQLSNPNAQGVAMGHIHLNAADPDAAIAFWSDVIGAGSFTHETLKGVSTQGVVILFAKKVPTGPSAGTIVDRISLNVPDVQAFKEKLAKTSYKFSETKPDGTQITVDGPDGVRIELNEDNAMYAPLEFRGLDFVTPDKKAMHDWYQQHFGSSFGRRGGGDPDAVGIPGANFAFEEKPGAAPTAGRAIDHIGFEVKNLEAFCKKLTDSGVKLDTPFRTVDQIKLSLAFLTDPWGTRIELTEGLAK